MSLDDLQAHLRGALDQQFATLRQQYEQALDEARQQARVEAEQQAAESVAAARAELEAQMAAIVSATRAEAKQEAQEAARAQLAQLEQQLQQQLEQTVQHAVNSVRRTSELEAESLRRRMENELQAERDRGQAALNAQRQETEQSLAALRVEAEEALAAARQRGDKSDAERQRIEEELTAERQRGEQTLAAERGKWQQDLDAAHARVAEIETVQQQLEAELATARADAAAAVAARASQPVEAGSAPAFGRVPDAVRALDAAPSLSQVLDALLQHAAAMAGRAALFLINGDRLSSWKAIGIPEIDVRTVESSIGGRDLLARAVQSGQPTPASPDLPAPPFARLAAGQPSLAVPLMVGGRAVAVLYADAGDAAAPAGWNEAVELTTRHASAVAAVRSALRTFDVLRGGATETPLAGDAPANGGDESARRYARLLVSEIKLYNEAAVRTGRQQRDLRQRLRGEIDRAQRLYEERVPPAVGARAQYFQQELVHTLADGDPSLLGH